MVSAKGTTTIEHKTEKTAFAALRQHDELGIPQPRPGETAKQALGRFLDKLRLTQSVEDMQTDLHLARSGETVSMPSKASIEGAQARVDVAIDRFTRGEPI